MAIGGSPNAPWLFLFRCTRFYTLRIAKSLGRAKSSIVREINRNKNEFGDDLPNIAQLKTIERNKLKYLSFKKITPKVKEYVAKKLKLKWSPAQISGRMKQERIAKISSKQIYRYINTQK